MKENCIAIIPARGGSKRIPKKNIRLFNGKPIIAYSINVACAAECFDDVMVSTEDAEIAAIARSFSASIPFMRSSENASDFATTANVILEVLENYSKLNQTFSYCCCIYPTAPFIKKDKLLKGFELIRKTDADSVIPVVRFGHPIQRALKIHESSLFMINPENMNTRTQDFNPMYHDAGQFYWLKVKSFLQQKKLLMQHTLPLEVSRIDVQDIDNEDDWMLAEIKHRLIGNNQKKN